MFLTFGGKVIDIKGLENPRKLMLGKEKTGPDRMVVFLPERLTSHLITLQESQ